MKKNVLQILTTRFTLDGVSNVVKNYTSILSDEYHFDFLFCRGTDEAGAEFVNSIGGNIIKIDVSRNRKPLAYMNKLSKELKKRDYDIVHVHGNSGTMFFDIHGAKMAKVPVRIPHCHSTSSASKALHYLLKPFLNMDMTKGIACSTGSKKWLFTRNTVILNNAIKTENYRFSKEYRDELKKTLGIEGKFAILCVGHFTPEKNFSYILDRFANILAKKPEAVLVILGEGKLRCEIDKKIAELGIDDKVIMPGRVSDANRYYSMADCYAMPSIFEGLPLALVEAQASGLPCVVSANVSREADVTGNVTYVPLEDTEAWEKCLLDAEIMNDSQKAKMSDDAILSIKENGYDITENAHELGRIYCE